MQALSETNIREKLKGLPGWELKNGALCRDLKFKDFTEAFSFMTQVALFAESANHHPDWENVYNRVNIRLNTHDASGVTEKDFALASKINSCL